MAEPSRDRKYLKLDDVRAHYDPKHDLISLTSTDDDLRGLGGLKIDVATGSKAYGALKEVMQNHGVIQDRPWASRTDAEDLALFDSHSEPREIPLGVNIQGELVSWSIDQSPNLWIYGMEGSGAALARRSVLTHALTQNWWISGIDIAQKGLPKELTDADATFPGIRNLQQLANLLERRLRLLEKRGKGPLSPSEIRNEAFFKPVLFLVEDIGILASIIGNENNTYGPMVAGMLSQLRKLSKLGPLVDIHLVISAPALPHATGDEEALELILAEHLPEAERNASYLVFGEIPTDSLPTAVRSDYKPFRSHVAPGRGHLISSGFQTELAVLYVPEQRFRELFNDDVHRG